MNTNMFILDALNVFSRVTTNRGSSLLEVLMAMVLVSIVIVGISGFSTVSITGMSLSQKMTIAATLAQDQMEEVHRVGYQRSITGVVTSTEPYGAMSDAPLFKRTVVVEAEIPASGMQTVTVTVAWDADAHATSLSTLLTE
ncbi:type IV pilus modification PilV family protein [Nitrospira sp. M1]